MLLPLLLEFYCCFLACYNFTASSPTLRSSTLRKFTAVSLAVTILLLLPLVLEILLLLPLYCYCFAADAASLTLSVGGRAVSAFGCRARGRGFDPNQ